ncbi:hypothetical protein [Phycicoccus avicenniae]|uniref:hypothetical protein n=1 Tax=Phycicoccus avicenniae TaxID=2828860 RepID=UPI003D29DC63
MGSAVPEGRSRVVRAGLLLPLLLPLLTGVLAMHVLLLCSDGAGAAGHAGHASATHGMPAHSVHLLGADPVTVGSAAPGPTAEASSTAELVCVAVLGAVVVLVLRRRGVLAPAATGTAAPRTVVLRRLSRPPPSIRLPVLLCVSRT